jgi:KDO2-lipid IV(A) lauroyltransferase
MEKIARFAIWAVGRFSFPTVRRMGRLLGIVLFLCARARRRTALDNLELAYGDELDPSEKRRIAQASFINLVTLGLEFCWMRSNRLPPDQEVRVLNPEVLRKSVDEGQGVILLVPHMGNWEASAKWFTEQGYVTHAVTRKQKQEWVTRIVRETRQAMGTREIDKRNALRPVLAALRRREIVLMLIDQYASKDSVEVRFFGKPARTAASVALLAAKTGCNVQVACCFRFPDYRFGGVYSDPIETVVSGDRERDLVENTQRYVAEIEKYVRKHPEDWMWMHRRWKQPR